MNTTIHPVAPEEVMAFLDGELSAVDMQVVSKHLEHCTECAAIAEQLDSTSHSLSQWSVQTLPMKLEDSVTDLAAKIRSGLNIDKASIFIRASFWTRKQWTIGLGATAAALLLVIAIATPNLMRSSMGANESSAIGQRRAQQVETEKSIREIEISPYDGKLTAGVNKAGGGGGDRLISPSSSLPKAISEVGGEAQQPAKPPQTPMIARAVSLTLVVMDFTASRATLDAILARHHSYAAELTANTTENAPRSLHATLRVPAPELASVSSELKSLGRMENEAQSGEEVTQQHADLVARLKNSRETEQRLQAILLQRTGKVRDILEVEQEIARVRGEIEQMEAEQKTLEHRVEFATVNLSLTEEYKAQLNPPAASVYTRVHNALVAGYRNASETVLGIVLFFAEYGPTLLLWLMIIVLPILALWRRYRKTLATV
ncbi:MAG: DUF4349 domain-containing protein [Candidatus Acidiferrum sp.]